MKHIFIELKVLRTSKLSVIYVTIFGELAILSTKYGKDEQEYRLAISQWVFYNRAFFQRCFKDILLNNTSKRSFTVYFGHSDKPVNENDNAMRYNQSFVYS